ncbi:MAG: Maf family protein, partial [Longimicrobiales bacterium]
MNHPLEETAAPPLVLASQSPRRAEILKMLGLSFETLPAQIVEEQSDQESPRGYVERLARDKALAVSSLRPGSLVLGGDTVVVAQGQVIEKPTSPGHAVEMLQSLSGQEHQVFTGMALVAPEGKVHSTT